MFCDTLSEISNLRVVAATETKMADPLLLFSMHLNQVEPMLSILAWQ
jgi:hypothetical protein